MPTTALEEAVLEVRRYLNANPGCDYLTAATNVAMRIGDRTAEQFGHAGWHEFITAIKKEFEATCPISATPK